MIGSFIKTSPYTYMAGVVILLASHGFVYFKGREHGLEKYYALQASLESERQRAAIESERITGDVSKAWADALDHARRNPRIIRVRDNACEVPVPNPTGGIDGRPPHEGFGSAGDATITASQCEAYLNQGIADAAQLMALQRWIRKQSEATK